MKKLKSSSPDWPPSSLDQGWWTFLGLPVCLGNRDPTSMPLELMSQHPGWSLPNVEGRDTATSVKATWCLHLSSPPELGFTELPWVYTPYHAHTYTPTYVRTHSSHVHARAHIPVHMCTHTPIPQLCTHTHAYTHKAQPCTHTHQCTYTHPGTQLCYNHTHLCAHTHMLQPCPHTYHRRAHTHTRKHTTAMPTHLTTVHIRPGTHRRHRFVETQREERKGEGGRLPLPHSLRGLGQLFSVWGGRGEGHLRETAGSVAIPGDCAPVSQRYLESH